MQVANKEEKQHGTESTSHSDPTFNWPKEAKVLHGRLEDTVTGEIFDVASAGPEDTVTVSKFSPNRPFTVMSTSSSPTYRHESSPGPLAAPRIELKRPEFQYRSPRQSQERAKRNRYEEHREHVAQLRKEIGDVDQAIATFAKDFLGDEGMAILSDWTDYDLREGDDDPLADHAW